MLDLAKAAEREGLVASVGIWSHFAWADAPGHPTIELQSHVFRQALVWRKQASISLEVRHLANSACTLTRPDLHFDLVRPGIAVYGLPPVEDPAGKTFGLKPAMCVTSELVLVKHVPAGQGVSYGHDYVTVYPTTLGLVSAGYADGVFRAGGSVAEVPVRGRRYRIAGRVCMDQFVIDLGPATAVCAATGSRSSAREGPAPRTGRRRWARSTTRSCAGSGACDQRRFHEVPRQGWGGHARAWPRASRPRCGRATW